MKHVTLFAHCQPAFFETALAGLPSHHVRMIRCIVLHNIQSGRVTGLLAQHNDAEIVEWLAGYVAEVRRHFAAERSAWLALHDRAQQIACFDTLNQHATRYAASPAAVVDITVTALTLLDTWVRDYPFDISLSRWIETRVQGLTIAATRHSPHETWLVCDDEQAQNWLDVPDEQSLDAFDSVERSLDMRLWLASVPKRDLRILQLKSAGRSDEQIAALLHRKLKTIQNRLSHLRKDLEEMGLR